jgi:hypothetical protein
MVRRKRKRGRSKDWHHRVPDFKLVYCGLKKSPKEESKYAARKRKIAIFEETDRDDTITELERPRKKEKNKANALALQNH